MGELNTSENQSHALKPLQEVDENIIICSRIDENKTGDAILWTKASGPGVNLGSRDFLDHMSTVVSIHFTFLNAIFLCAK